jgi:hypothetical protein
MVVGSRRFFQDDAVGRAYLDALDLSAAPRLASARLPRIDEARPLGPDEPGDPFVGNVLLFVREGDAVGAVADAAAQRVRRVDTYRFVCVYPSRTARRLVFGQGPALDLVLWRSVAFPNHAQILAIADPTERASVVRDLETRLGHGFAWDPAAGADDGFFALDEAGTVEAVPTPGLVLAEDAALSEGGLLVSRGAQLAPTRTDAVATRPVFAADDPSEWSPEGFEIKIAGASGSRKVWFHLVLECPAGRTSAVQGHTVIAAAKDM